MRGCRRDAHGDPAHAEGRRKLRAQGKSPEEIKRFMADALVKGLVQPTARPGVTYMLSTENIVPDGKGGTEHFPPSCDVSTLPI